MGDAAQRAGLPRELPVMAALVESGLKNDNYGDRDSLGFFQMRTSIWDHGKYAGFPKTPACSCAGSSTRPSRSRRRGCARASPGSATTRQCGDWIADIERPAAQYRGRYQLQLEAARQLLR